jgi:hypothetical protein
MSIEDPRRQTRGSRHQGRKALEKDTKKSLTRAMEKAPELFGEHWRNLVGLRSKTLS